MEEQLRKVWQSFTNYQIVYMRGFVPCKAYHAARTKNMLLLLDFSIGKSAVLHYCWFLAIPVGFLLEQTNYDTAC